MKIKSMHLEFFKGVTDVTYNFFDRTRVSAENGKGKTTIATAHYWLWCGRNYELVNEPNIRPNGLDECQPRVTEVIDINGKEITVCKYQKCSKKTADGKTEYAYANKYEVNSVGMSKRDFDKYFEEEGIKVADILACSHPDVFTGQKDKDMRPVILSMASAKSDLDIALMNDDTKDLAELLKSYKLAEIDAMQKATKTRAKQRQTEIPSIIEGLEMAKADVDVAEAELNKRACEDKIKELDEKINNSGKALSDLMGKAMQLKFDLSAIQQPMNDDLVKSRRAVEDKLHDVGDKMARLANDCNASKGTINLNNERINTLNDEVEKLRAEFMEVKATKYTGKVEFNESEWVFDESSTVCSLCGQRLPQDKIEELKASFNEKKERAKSNATKKFEDESQQFEIDKKKKLDFINHTAKLKNEEIKKLKALNKEVDTALDKASKEHDTLSADYENLKKELDAMPTEVDFTANKDYVDKKAELDKVEAEIEKLKNADDSAIAELKNEREQFTAELKKATDLIAKASLNVANDEKIEELNREKKEKEQIVTNCQKILDEIATLSRRKNELLVDEINSHFKIVKWKLFDYQKNGEYKDVCVPMIGDKTFTESMNTGLKIQAKLDICDGLQRFYNVSLPVFLDNAESINDENIPATDCQLIALKVVDKGADLEVKEM